MYPITPAPLLFDGHTPISTTYDDVYFSRADGLEESRYVFLYHNDLPARFTNTQYFTIGETGFGTGLNFLLTVDIFLKHAPTDACLCYISMEKHPLSLQDITQAHRLFPSLSIISDALIAAYPLPIYGIHHRHLLQGRVHLILCYGDAADFLPLCQPETIDTWFLDGFAPAKNPDMWTEANLLAIGASTKAGGTYATFTAAGAVKRALVKAGFEVHKVTGYGYKRDMLKGSKPVKASLSLMTSSSPRHVAVIGGGIAGACAAYACAIRGIEVSLYERHPVLAKEASGNPAGILYPFMASQWDNATSFYLQGFAHTVSLLRQFGADIPHALCGMEFHPKDASMQEIKRLQSLPDTLGLAPDIAIPTDYGLFMPHSGWVNVPALVERLAMHPLIHPIAGITVESVEYRDNHWHLEDDQKKSAGKADALIIANAWEAHRLFADTILPMRRIKGQITYLPESYLTDVSTVLCHQGYITPSIEGIHYLGATFEQNSHTLDLTQAGHEENLKHLAERFPHVIKHPVKYWDSLNGRAAFRTVSSDRMPIIGQLHNQRGFDDITAGKPYTAYLANNMNIPLLPHLYVTLAHGARGIVSAPLAGEMIAARLVGEPFTALPAIEELLSPVRFSLRRWRKHGKTSSA